MRAVKQQQSWRTIAVRRGEKGARERGTGEPPTDAVTARVVRVGAARKHGRRIVTKATGKEWRTHYRATVEIGLVLSLLVLVAVTRAPIYRSSDGINITLAQQEVVTVEEIRQTRQIERPPPPPRPPVPVEVADDAVIDDEELNLDATLDIANTPQYVPSPQEPVMDEPDEEVDEIFVVVEQMPEIIGGANRLYEHLEYPVIARQAMMEGLVVVQVVVEPDGTASSPTVVRSAGKILDDAAVAAVMSLGFRPGMQRGRAVRVKMAIPIRFQLRDRRD